MFFYIFMKFTRMWYQKPVEDYSSLSWLGSSGKIPKDGVFGVFIGKYLVGKACGEENKVEERLLRIPKLQ